MGNSSIIDKDGNLKFNTRYKKKIFEISEQQALKITDTIESLNKRVFQNHPLQEPITASLIMDDIINNDLIKRMLRF